MFQNQSQHKNIMGYNYLTNTLPCTYLPPFPLIIDNLDNFFQPFVYPKLVPYNLGEDRHDHGMDNSQ